MTLQTVLLKSSPVEVNLPELTKPLVKLMDSKGLVTEFLSPYDCLMLGVHDCSYFDSSLSLALHDDCPWLAEMFPEHEAYAIRNRYAKSYCGGAMLASANYFGVSASTSYDNWLANGWIQPGAPEGNFEAYTLYCYLQTNGGICSSGKLPGFNGLTVDWQSEQKRMLSFASRHGSQIVKSARLNLTKRRKQRQALLNWASPLAFA